MKKIYLFIFTGLLLTISGFSQVTVTVTNPTNTTPNLAASYTSLANAITAVNAITAMSGPVTLTCAAGTETAPAGGYSITLVVATSATNTITFTTSGTVTLTASAALTVSAVNDAIFKLIGADYITISGFTMQENAANTISATSATNNMTEWGVALLHASVTDGAQNNTIQNNSISLSRTYLNTYGIYSNVRHSATSITGTQDITNNTTGPNSNNKVYGNTISNVNMGITFIGSGTAANQDVNNDIGGSSLTTGNTISNWGGAAPLTNPVSNSGTSYCIFSNNQTGDNISYNTITSAAISGTAVTFVGIRKDYTASQPLGTFTNNITNNTVTMTSGFTSGTFDAILNQGMTTLSTATVNISNNTILNCAMTGPASSSSFFGIDNTSVPGILNMNNNAIRGYTSTATTGGFTGMRNNAAIVTTVNMNNNQLGNGVTGPVTFGVITTGSINGIQNSVGTAGANISISNNTIDGISCLQSGTITAINITGGTNSNFTVNGNTFINTTVSGAGATGSTIAGISNNATATTFTANNNIIRGHTTTSTTGGFTGIQNTSAVVTTIDISNNIIGNASTNAVTFSAATNTNLQAIIVTGAATTATVGVTNNSIVGLAGVSTSGSTYGILASCSAATINITGNSLGSASRDLINYSAASTGSVYAIVNFGGVAATNLNITGNTVDRITGVSFSAGAVAGIINTASAIGGTLNLNNNAIGTTTGTFITTTASSSSAIYAMYNSNGANTATVNMNNNTVDGLFINSTSINLTVMALNGANVLTAMMSGNSFGSTGTLINFAAAQPAGGTFRVMDLGSGSSTATSTITCQNNTVRNIIFSTTSLATSTCIFINATPLTATISGNQFNNLTLNVSGNAWMILDIASRPSGKTLTVNNNSIVTGANKTASGGFLAGAYSGGSSVNGSISNITNNNFSNMTVTGSAGVYGIENEDGASTSSGPTKTITGNTISNISFGSGTVYGFNLGYGAATNCSNNTISNISGTGYIAAINNDYNDGQGTVTYSNNTINNLVSSGTGSFVYGIYGSFPAVPTTNINDNTITNLSSTGASAGVVGIYPINGQAINVYNNQINNLSGSGTTFPQVYGLIFSGGTTINVYNNKIHTLSETGAVSFSAPAILGISINGGTTVSIYNNFLANFSAPNANMDNAIAGIYMISSTASTAANLYYNSIYLNASSTGTDFGTAGVYHLTNATATTGALNMIDNIVVNTSTANGTGVTAAYRRSDATLTNFASTSDYNLFYAGTPSATRLIFYDGTNSDQTLAAYQTRVSTRDANSISLMPTFTSSTDLHLTTANCRIDGRGTPVGSVTTDIDAAVRNATTPDIGADEFTATTSTNLAGVTGSAVCEDRTIAVTGTTYTSNACDLIAYVLPSGGAPVAGKVNVCVTLDATQQYFNGEPYVQRHFDIEPTTSNQTTTSATITLYFTDAEFVLYNTNNPVQPPLPTNGAGNTVANRNNVKVTQFHGAASTSPSSPGNYPGVRVLITPGAANVFWNGTYWEVTFNVAGFSGFYVHTNNFNAPLPIVVNYLTGRRQGSNHLLNWKVTCTSSPRATMILERSSDARNFSGLYTITADAARCQQPFDYTDANPLKGMNYYRLKIVDADGHVTYSTTVALLNAVKGFDIVSIAPNPVVSNNFKLNVASAVAGKMELVIFDMQGRLVNRQTISLIAGFNNMPVNVANLAPGTYTIKGSMTDDQSKVIRFVKQ